MWKCVLGWNLCHFCWINVCSVSIFPILASWFLARTDLRSCTAFGYNFSSRFLHTKAHCYDILSNKLIFPDSSFSLPTIQKFIDGQLKCSNSELGMWEWTPETTPLLSKLILMTIFLWLSFNESITIICWHKVWSQETLKASWPRTDWSSGKHMFSISNCHTFGRQPYCN